MSKWISRKFLVMLASAVLTPLMTRLGIPSEVQMTVLAVIGAWIAGQSLVDAAAARNGSVASVVIAKSGTPAEVASAAKSEQQVTHDVEKKR